MLSYNYGNNETNFIFALYIQGRCLSLIQAASDVQEQGAVDDRDSFLHGVRDLLSIHSSSQHYHFTKLFSFA